MKRSILFLLLLASLFGAEAVSWSQTVESVLRALQQRQMMLRVRDKKIGSANPRSLITWPAGVAAYPENGSISTLPDALQCLNQASKVYDVLKSEFVAANLATGQLRETYESVYGYSYLHPEACRLPSIGTFDENNWRAKLVALASQVDQLQCLEWPISSAAYGENTFTDGTVEQRPYAVSTLEPLETAVEINFPNIEINNPLPYWINDVPYPTIWRGRGSIPVSSSSAEHFGVSLLSWNIGGSASTSDWTGTPITSVRLMNLLFCAYGVVGKLGAEIVTQDLPGWSPSFAGAKMWLYKRPSISTSSANLSEIYSNQANDKLRFGVLTPVAMEKVGTEFIKGNPSETPGAAPEAISKLCSIFDLPNPNFTGSFVENPVSNDEPYVLKITQANAFAGTMGFNLEITGFAVLDAEFDRCLPADAGACRFAGLQHGIGEIETTLENWEKIRVHLGRGNGDQNQQAWLTVSPSGFGSVVFHGSPVEFNLTYGYPGSPSHPTEPIGGRTFQGEFADSSISTNTGWFSRERYIAEWFLPRLTKVEGSDAVVTIQYCPDELKKIIIISAKDGTYIKTIEIENTGGNVSGVPKITSGTFRVNEEQTRFYTITGPQTLWNSTLTGVFEVKMGPSFAAPIWQRKTTILDPVNANATWTEEETLNNVLVRRTTDTYVSLATSPLKTEAPQPLQRNVETNGETRTVDWVWTPSASSGNFVYTIPTLITFSGANWELDGCSIQRRLNGTALSESRLVAGVQMETTHHWSGNEHVATSALGTDVFRTESQIYSDHFTKLEVVVDDNDVETLYFNSDSEESGPALSLRVIQKPGGYQEKFSYLQYSDGVNPHQKVQVQSGWGNSFALGTSVEVTSDRFGGIVSKVVTASSGAAIEEATGSSFTSWGAPRTVNYKRGTQPAGSASLAYNESGIDHGTVLSSTDPFNVVRSVSDRDLLGRPGSVNNGFSSTNFLYPTPFSVSYSGPAGSGASTVSGFGDVRQSSSSVGTRSSSFTKGANGSGTITNDGRSVSFAGDPSGFVNDVANGAGSRGESITIGVGDPMPSFGIHSFLYVEAKEKVKGTGYESGNFVRRYFDGLGRVVATKYRGADGYEATDNWIYNDAANQVTHLTSLAPLAQGTRTTISNNGEVVTLELGKGDGSAFREYFKKTRTATGSTVKVVTEVNNDSSGSVRWDEVSSETLNYNDGTSSTTPWEIPANGLTISQSVPGPNASITVADAATGSSLTTSIQNGLPQKIEGNVGGIPIDKTISTSNGLLTGVTGSVGGLESGFTMGSDRRVSQMTAPGVTKNFSYATTGEGGFTTTVKDQSNAVVGSVATDSVGDVLSVVSERAPPLTMTTTDVNGGRSTEFSNRALTISSNFDGLVTRKSYGGQIQESLILNADGSLQEFTEGSVTISVSQNPRERTVEYPDGTKTEEFYDVGVRKSVKFLPDERKFTYHHLQLKTEEHTSGPWSGVTVVFEPDGKDRLGTIRVSGAGIPLKEFSFQYDAYSRLSASNCATGINAIYNSYTTHGMVSSLTRGSVSTAWAYHGASSGSKSGLLQSVTNAVVGGNEFKYTFENYDSKRRHSHRLTTTGIAWTDLVYGNYDQLTHVTLGNGRSLDYGYDPRGNRISQDSATQSANSLDQITGRNISSRWFALVGSVAPGAAVDVFTSLQPAWTAIQNLNSVTGEFSHYTPVSSGFNGGKAALITSQVRGTLPPVGEGDSPAVAVQTVDVLVPPTVESFVYDPSTGRLLGDGYWTYSWDAAGRLKSMVRKEGAMPRRDVKSETLTFGYDADGRRTGKTHTVIDTSNHVRSESSKVLWAGWLPIMEERTKTVAGNTTSLPRRWFQWGVDLSGSLDGAGGIGGLVAIIEEGGRTLLPIHDGLGNITAVVDNVTKHTVARYDCGPFGEPLNESGDVDACPFRWQTKWYDAECQHYYFGYRHYDPRMGRWLSRDPLGEAGGFNLYGYCGNDPVNRYDFLGLDQRSEVEAKYPHDAWALIQAGWASTGDPIWNDAGELVIPMEHRVKPLFTGYNARYTMPVADARILAPNDERLNRPMPERPRAALGMRNGVAHLMGEYIDGHVGFRLQKVILSALPAAFGRWGFAALAEYAPTTSLVLGYVGSASTGIAAAEIYQNGFNLRWDDWATIAVTARFSGAFLRSGPKLELSPFAAKTGVPIGYQGGPGAMWIGENIGAGKTFEIIDGVRRAKAAQMLGHDSITAKMLVNGEVQTVDVSIQSLLSPKSSINVSNAVDAQRFSSTLEKTRLAPVGPDNAIWIQPGTKGTSIPGVQFNYGR